MNSASWPFGASEMAGRIRDFDWSTSAMGSIGAWPQNLRATVNLMLASPHPACILWGADAACLYNDAMKPMLGLRRANDVLGRPFAEAWPEVWAIFSATIAEAMAGRAHYVPDREIRLPHRDTASWFTFSWTPVLDDRGSTAGCFGIIMDMTSNVLAQHLLRDSEVRGKVLLGQLQHRVRNTLSVVRSIVRRSMDSGADVESFVMNLEGRLAAFSRTQSLLTADPTSGIDFGYLIAEELRAYGGRDDSNIAVSGPKLRLQPRAAEMFALAVHELATNAIKHGALSDPHGRIRVHWQTQKRDGDHFVALDWVESRGPRPTVGGRRGFGMELLETGIAYELQARTQIELRPGGLHCRIELPMLPHIFQLASPTRP